MANLVIADPDLVLVISGQPIRHNAGVAMPAGKSVQLDGS